MYYTVGHGGKFGYVQWAIVADWLRYRPLRGMKPYSKNLDNFCPVACSAGFGYVLRAMALNQLHWRRTTTIFQKAFQFFKGTMRQKVNFYRQFCLGLCHPIVKSLGSVNKIASL
jgi:hypothetical protein